MSANPLHFIQQRIAQQVRDMTHTRQQPEVFLQPAGDPGLLGPHSSAWQVHAHFMAMMVGGIASLIVQALHPRALAGVWDHSSFRDDLGARLGRTAFFIAATTYGGRAMAEQAMQRVEQIYAFQGAGHSVGLHSALHQRALDLGLRLPVARVIVDQAHCIATGGSFDNGLPFSLSMGCGTWGKNNFSENMNYRHYLNITRVARPIPERMPSEDDVLGGYFSKYGRT